jgi:hypothetical protein
MKSWVNVPEIPEVTEERRMMQICSLILDLLLYSIDWRTYFPYDLWIESGPEKGHTVQFQRFKLGNYPPSN